MFRSSSNLGVRREGGVPWVTSLAVYLSTYFDKVGKSLLRLIRAFGLFQFFLLFFLADYGGEKGEFRAYCARVQ